MPFCQLLREPLLLELLLQQLFLLFLNSLSLFDLSAVAIRIVRFVQWATSWLRREKRLANIIKTATMTRLLCGVAR